MAQYSDIDYRLFFSKTERCQSKLEHWTLPASSLLNYLEVSKKREDSLHFSQCRNKRKTYSEDSVSYQAVRGTRRESGSLYPYPGGLNYEFIKKRRLYFLWFDERASIIEVKTDIWSNLVLPIQNPMNRGLLYLSH